jgi:DNA-3-methyladenine glycosylase II
MKEFTIEPKGGFSLAQSHGFLKGFTPGMGTYLDDRGDFVLAFLADSSFAPVAVKLTQDGNVHGRVYGDVDVRDQVARILAIDVDGRGYDEMLAKDAKLATVAAKFPGFRPVSFSSPYEAAVWGVLAQRIPMKVAASVRKKIAQELGGAVDVDGRTMHVFPAPAALLAKKSFAGVPEEKWLRLHGIAQAALDGVLDAKRLSAMKSDDALAFLGELRGVGAWTASHILLRGTGAQDVFSDAEPRVLAAARFAYDQPKLDDDALAKLAEAWRPFRTWVMVLLALHLSRFGEWKVGARRGGSLKKKLRKRS